MTSTNSNQGTAPDSTDAYIRIPLHSKKHPNLFALVDPEDAELVNQYRWHPSVKVGKWIYAQTNLPQGGSVLMHRLILALPPRRPLIDHASGDGLDNRRANLRVCGNQQNQGNRRAQQEGSSVYKGVHWHRRLHRWRSGIVVNGRPVYLGIYETEVDAALAYDAAARIRHGEYAAVNFPDPGERSALTGEISS